MSGISAQYVDGLEIMIAELREQVEKLTKERDDLRSRRCEVCGYLEHEREHTGCLREQLATLAEQNEKMRVALQAMVDEAFARNCGLKIADDALSLPNLASPVLNRIRAEGMRMARDIARSMFNRSATGDEIADELDAKAAELEKQQ